MGILCETDTLYFFKYTLNLSHPKSIQFLWNLTLIRAAGEPQCLKAKGTEQILGTKLLQGKRNGANLEHQAPQVFI